VAGAAGSSNQAVHPQPYDPADAPADYLVGPDDPARARRLAWADRFQRTFREMDQSCSN
jgi:hypothetical protein